MGFGVTFCITALLQGLAVCVLLPLASFVPRGDVASTRADSMATTTTGLMDATAGRLPEEFDADLGGDLSSQLQQPLLNAKNPSRQTSD